MDRAKFQTTAAPHFEPGQEKPKRKNYHRGGKTPSGKSGGRKARRRA